MLIFGIEFCYDFDNLDYLYQQRKLAIEVTSERTNFLTKHLNIFLQSSQDEVYIDTDKWDIYFFGYYFVRISDHFS